MPDALQLSDGQRHRLLPASAAPLPRLYEVELQLADGPDLIARHAAAQTPLEFMPVQMPEYLYDGRSERQFRALADLTHVATLRDEAAAAVRSALAEGLPIRAHLTQVLGEAEERRRGWMLLSVGQAQEA